MFAISKVQKKIQLLCFLHFCNIKTATNVITTVFFLHFCNINSAKTNIITVLFAIEELPKCKKAYNYCVFFAIVELQKCKKANNYFAFCNAGASKVQKIVDLLCVLQYWSLGAYTLGGYSLGPPDWGLRERSTILEEIYRTLQRKRCLGKKSNLWF